MKTEEARNIIDQHLETLSDSLAAGQSDQLKEFLGTMARFHRYSFGNLLLIMAQRPDATNVAGYGTWKSLGRFVREGERGIAILAPIQIKTRSDSTNPPEDGAGGDPTDTVTRFRVVYVFDVAQTDGEPLPQFAQPQGDPGDRSERLRNLARQLSIELEYSEDLGGALGLSKGGRIVIKSDLEPAQEFATLVHEIAHELLHHGEHRQATTKTQRETEAEAVAFVVSQAVGLDLGTASSDYIQLYRGDKELLAQSLHSVRQTAARILDAIL